MMSLTVRQDDIPRYNSFYFLLFSVYLYRRMSCYYGFMYMKIMNKLYTGESNFYIFEITVFIKSIVPTRLVSVGLINFGCLLKG